MAELVKGTLFFEKAKRKWQIEFFNASKNKQSTVDCDAAQLSADIPKNEDEKLEVEFERDPRYGNPLKVRPAGQDYKSSAAAKARAHEWIESMSNFQFHNPYNFIPTPERKTSDELGERRTANDLGELGDKLPSGHDCYHSSLFSGKLRVQLKVVTPLLIPDTSRAIEHKYDKKKPDEIHKSFPLRVGVDGKPHLAVTSVKGMLRSAYEAVTNSRLSVFTKHDERLGFRMEATEGAMMVPVRIEGKPGAEEIVFCTGMSELYKDGRPFNRQRETNRKGEPRNGLLCAAWLPMYTTQRPNRMDSWRIDDQAIRPVDDNARLPKHGERVFAWLKEEYGGNYWRWRVIKLATAKAALGSAPSGIEEIEGYVCNTGHNIDRKHDEKIFFKDINNPLPINNVKLTIPLRKAWDALIKNYRHEHDNEDGVLSDPPTARWRDRHTREEKEIPLEWSRHIQRTDAEETSLDAELNAEKLEHGALCYARVKQINGSDFEVLELIPVIISRRIHKYAPAELLSDRLHPVQKLAELSPADRVFGWVKQPPSKFRAVELTKEEKKRNAYRGQLRIGLIECVTPKEQAIKCLTEGDGLQDKKLGLPLSILGAPKPQQGRFYVAKDKQGHAQDNGLNNELAGYTGKDKDGNDIEKGLRGRKVYPHHANLPYDYWENPTSLNLDTSKSEQGFFKEYRHTKDSKGRERDNQNRSVQGWVERGTEFEFDVHFINLSGVELGALLWLLKLNDGKDEPDHFFRLGGGKPLGFGSVRLELKGCDVRDGAAWREYYGCLSAANEPDHRAINPFIVEDESNKDKSGAEQLVKAYQAAVCEAYKRPDFKHISFIAAFLRAATGFETNLPIHYPRARHPNEQDESIYPASHADGLAYEWFVENNRRDRQYSLPDLEADEGLPIWDKK